MLDDEKPPYIQNIPEDEDQGAYPSQIENAPQEQYQEDIISENEQIDNILYQQPLIESTNNFMNENFEDILKKSSLNDFNDNPYNQSTQVETQNFSKISNSPIKESQPLQNNLNENKVLLQSVPNNNNPLNFSTIGPNNNNNIYSTENPIINQPIISYNQYDSNNSNIIYSYPYNNYQYPQETVIVGEYPTTIQTNEQNNPNIQNIYYSTPIISSPKIINDFQNQNKLNQTFYNRNPNNIKNLNNSKGYAQVVHSDNNLMKKPEITKVVNENQRNINNYISNNGKGRNIDNKINNFKNNDIKQSYNNKLKAKNYNPGNMINSINVNDFKNLDNFSPNFWRYFYEKDESFFKQPIGENIIHNQTLTNQDKSEIYYGDINNENKKHGFGKLIGSNLQRIGTWNNDVFNGWGREIKNGEIFEGKFINGALNGKGIIKDGAVLYVGEIVNYIKHGKGEIFTSSFHYNGNFNNDNIEGKGRMEIYDEGIYEGDFNNGQITGYGTFKYKNGNFYEGEMKNGKMNGMGKLSFPNGNVFEGKFVDGEFISESNNNSKRMYTYNE